MIRASLQIAVGSYTGNNTDNTNITGVGFRPQLIIIKGGANAVVFRTSFMSGDFTAYISSASVGFANGIQELLTDGFQVGTDANVNAASTTYYYIAMRGSAAQQYLRMGQYVGNGIDDRNFTTGAIGFTPEMVFIKGETGNSAVWRSSTMTGDSTAFFGGTVSIANLIQNLQSNGFQLGNPNNVNGSGILYNWVAMKSYAPAIFFGTFTGDGRDNRSITGIGFQPDIVIVKNTSSTLQGRLRTSSMSGDISYPFGLFDSDTDWVQSLSSDGFVVGASANVSTQIHHYIAIKAGNYNPPLARVIS